MNVRAVPTLSGETPIVIAHRGASGNVIEHTLEAYQRGIDDGADFIEPDLVLTKDGVLVARHENEISGTTNVAQKPEFADRKTTKIIDGRGYTGWFTEDFTLAELKTLRAKERLPELRPANAQYDGDFAIPTFEEILQLLKEHEAKAGERIGVYPETKHPSYFTSIGLAHQGALLELLNKYGFDGADDPVFIQSFEVGNLQQLATKTKIRLVQLVADQGGPPDRNDLSYANMVTPAGLAEIAKYASGLGPSKSLIIGRDAQERLGQPSSLVADAHEAGLVVHPWTFRIENVFLPSEFKGGYTDSANGDVKAEIKAYLATGIDGLFSDNPREAALAVDQFGTE
ncbi:glycerophosphodiester phosphodiesterase [Parasphingorhabdus cellanae]|uniref:glycerophosphodiester phosphodiesterase n=1 Tax=Parasphingorhabdus cellanae TaxID=2806553 RepID=UPI001FB13E55|nr:glycerophosphodiester phosphodiesterase [Parasphingorhabdus cellanae]